MGHNIKYYSYPASTDTRTINTELDNYARKATWQEGGHGLHSPIRFIDHTLDSYEEAAEYIKNHDKGWYDQLAVKYRTIPNGKTSKKIEELRVKLSDARRDYHTLNSEIAAKSFKADYVGCKHCGSKINRTYIKTNFCPVCQSDMRSETTQKKLQTLKAKIEKIEQELKDAEKAFVQKNAEVFWLVKIEYHT